MGLDKAFEARVFSIDREKELEEAAARSLETKDSSDSDRRRRVMYPSPQQSLQTTAEQPKQKASTAEANPLADRQIHLTAKLAGELMDALARAYGQKWFQDRVCKCSRDSGYERSVFLLRLRDLAFEVQKPVLENWGFEGSVQGLREMTAAIRDHAADGREMPTWLKEKQDACLKLLYGGERAGMLSLLTS